ncbi:MAG: type IV toxin-antitoxin system AbiEi family antitoxin domain-containing protein [Anaerolineae bacterium]|jgi:predicted transcriptional regulator of viral defense system
MRLDTYDRLYQIAEAQAGYFTTAQARALGIARAQLSRYVAAGQLERSRHGIYRLTPFPRVPHEDLFIAWLAAGPDAIISHDSALALYELSDALPAHIHITVPRSASRRRTGYRLHTSRITPAEITHYGGMQVTTVARTIADIAFDGLADDLVIQAAQEAVARGLASPEQLLAAAAQRGPAVVRLIQRARSGVSLP